MNNTDKSILFFGIYMIVVGTILFLIPNSLLAMFGLPVTDEAWIRMGGLFSAIVGGYYLYAVKYKLIPFYFATVYGRITFAIGIIILILLQYTQHILLIIAFIDLTFALVTAYALKKQK